MRNAAASPEGACEVLIDWGTFGISETCYRYERKLGGENERIAELLLGPAQVHRTWGFGLCFLYLRNVKGHAWNHKRVYRIYRKLARPANPSHWAAETPQQELRENGEVILR